MSELTRLLVVPHTHWDREWYQTFEQFRMRLVHAIDRALDVMEADPDFTYFMLDGQTIVLEDYLEVRPEKEERLKRLTRAGRILVGPWYLQPDEFLVGGESLVRNLQMGMRIAEEYGGVMPVGYVPDLFGHIAQLPQILRGFGLDNAVFWRGVGPDVEQSEWRWAAPDGTAVLAVWLCDPWGYSNARSLPLDTDGLLDRVARMVPPLRQRATTNTLLLMNGSDHLEPQEGLPKAIAVVNPHLRRTGQEMVIGTLPQYIAAIEQDDPTLATYTGEMRSSRYAHLLPGVFSTRMWIKQRNAAAESLLTRWAEPMSAWAWHLGAEYPEGLLRVAWRHLLANHPHDSICGCSIDQVHFEMRSRFDRSEQIGEQLISNAFNHIAERMDTRPPASGRGILPVVIFNAGPGPASAVAFHAITGDRRDAATFEVPLLPGEVEVIDEDGRVVPFQVRQSDRTGLAEVTMLASGIPACGARVYFVRPTEGEAQPPESDVKVRANGLEITNEFYRVSVDADTGTLTLEDKASGMRFAGLNQFQDGGDVGDLYNYAPPASDALLSHPASTPLIELIASGPVRATLRVTATYALPATCAADRHSRSADTVTCEISTEVTLTAGGRRVDLRTTVANQARDHRLRVLFPTPIQTDVSLAEGAFQVVRRPVRLRPLGPEETPWSEWPEMPVNTYPQKRFVAVEDTHAGLAVLDRGLPEFEVLPAATDGGGVCVALTLLRCVEWLSRDDLSTRRGHAGPMLHTPEGQCLGTHVFDYALVPYSGAWDAADSPVLFEAQAFEAPLRALVTDSHQGTTSSISQLVGTQPATVVVSAIKRAEREAVMVLRVHNTSASDTVATITTGDIVHSVRLARLDETPLGEEAAVAHQLTRRRDAIQLSLRGGEIATLLLDMSRSVS